MKTVISEEDLRAEEIMIANVERGAAWLDSINPDWYVSINLENLDLSNSETCICGQIFCEDALQLALDSECEYGFDNGYEYALNTYFDGRETEAIRHGFQAMTNYTAKVDGLEDIIYAPMYRNPNLQYEFLAWQWIRQISIRNLGLESSDE